MSRTVEDGKCVAARSTENATHSSKLSGDGGGLCRLLSDTLPSLEARLFLLLGSSDVSVARRFPTCVRDGPASASETGAVETLGDLPERVGLYKLVVLPEDAEIFDCGMPFVFVFDSVACTLFDMYPSSEVDT